MNSFLLIYLSSALEENQDEYILILFFLLPTPSRQLLHQAVPSSDLSPEARPGFLENELEEIEHLHASGILDQVALKRAEILLEAHERFRKLLGGGKYKVVELVLPMDLMGVYVLLPERKR